MSIFFISAILGLIVHFAFLLYEPRRRRYPQRRIWPLRRRNNKSGDIYRLRRNVIVFSIISLAATAALLLLKQKLYLLLDQDVTVLEFLDMPAFGQFGFGLGFGIFAGYWLRTIIFRKSTEKATFSEIALTGLLGVFLLIGIIGERSLSRAFEHLTTLEAAGVKLGFSALSPKDGSIGPAYDSADRSSRISVAESEGLALVSLLYASSEGQQSQKQRDLAQTDFIAAASKDPNAPQSHAEATSQNGMDVIRPVVDCALQHARTNGDSDRLGEILRPFTAALRRAILLSEGGTNVNMTEGSDRVSESLETLQQEAFLSCCLAPYDSTYLTVIKPDAYTYIAIAGLLAYDHRYAAAVAMIERWLTMKRQPTIENTIRTIRVRGFLLTLIEEWLNGLNFVRPDKAILDYHLNNIGKQIALLEQDDVAEALKIVTDAMQPHDHQDRRYIKDRFTGPPDDHGTCEPVAEEKQKNALFLERALISAKVNWITVALDNPDYASKYAAKAKVYARELLNLDFSCLSRIEKPDAIDIRRKDTLEAYARVSLAAYSRPNQDNTDSRPNQDNIGTQGPPMRQTLETALQAVILGEYLLDQAEQERVGDDPQTSQPNHCTLHTGDETAPAHRPADMQHPIVKDFTKQSRADLKSLKRQIKQALESVD